MNLNGLTNGNSQDYECSTGASVCLTSQNCLKQIKFFDFAEIISDIQLVKFIFKFSRAFKALVKK